MASFPYDVKLTVGATEYGFMLSTPKGQSKQLHIPETGALQGQYDLVRLGSDENRTHSDFDAKIDTPLAQQSFAGGCGQLELDAASGDTQRYWWGASVTRGDGVACLPPPTTTKSLTSGSTSASGMCTYLSSAGTRYYFLWQSTRLYRYDDSGGAWTLVYTAGFAITDFKIIDGAGYIATPTETTATTDFLYQADVTAAATWAPTIRNHTVFSNALGKPSFFGKVRGWLYACVSPRKVFYSSDGTTDAWVGPIDTSLTGNYSGPPGDLTYNFVNVTTSSDYFMVFKKDAAYNIDSSQEVNEVIWQFKEKPATENFKHIAQDGDLLYYSCSPEVYAYDPGTGRNLNTGISKQSGFSVKEIRGVAADNGSVFILAVVRVPKIRSADCMALFRGTRTAAARWAFEVLWEDTADTTYDILGAFPGTSFGTRLIWSTTAGTSTLHMNVPAGWNETTSGSYATSGELFASIWRTGFPNFIKRWLWVTTRVTADATNTLAVAYSTDDGATFTTLNALVASSLVFNNFSSVNSEAIILRFRFVSAGTVTPVLTVYDLHARVRWRYLPGPVAVVRVADNIELRNQTQSPDTTATLAANLNTLRTTNSTIAYEDFLGNSFNVSIEGYDYQPSRHEQPENVKSPYEMEAVLRMARADSGA